MKNLWIQKYNSIIRNKRKKLDKIVLLAKTKLNILLQVLISKQLINSNIEKIKAFNSFIKAMFSII